MVTPLWFIVLGIGYWFVRKNHKGIHIFTHEAGK